MTTRAAIPFEQAVAALTGPGGPFELAVEDVNGSSMPVFKNRFRSLRDLLARSVQFGEAELAVWDTGLGPMALWRPLGSLESGPMSSCRVHRSRPCWPAATQRQTTRDRIQRSPA